MWDFKVFGVHVIYLAVAIVCAIFGIKLVKWFLKIALFVIAVVGIYMYITGGLQLPIFGG